MPKKVHKNEFWHRYETLTRLDATRKHLLIESLRAEELLENWRRFASKRDYDIRLWHTELYKQLLGFYIIREVEYEARKPLMNLATWAEWYIRQPTPRNTVPIFYPNQAEAQTI